MDQMSVCISTSGQERQCLGVTLYLFCSILDYLQNILCVPEAGCYVFVVFVFTFPLLMTVSENDMRSQRQHGTIKIHLSLKIEASLYQHITFFY